MQLAVHAASWPGSQVPPAPVCTVIVDVHMRLRRLEDASAGLKDDFCCVPRSTCASSPLAGAELRRLAYARTVAHNVQCSCTDSASWPTDWFGSSQKFACSTSGEGLLSLTKAAALAQAWGGVFEDTDYAYAPGVAPGCMSLAFTIVPSKPSRSTSVRSSCVPEMICSAPWGKAEAMSHSTA